ncbi:ankyrin repeat-containing domain protein [Mycena pura]|uniref:Ankyrin repeat-containing domain protein n=1 Tax=Mycena pura TaxID=153505 RepID=A0AAD6YAX0_9AGAR|nr:ankyrin repeat-containing domain protein [Mycena pura]
MKPLRKLKGKIQTTVSRQPKKPSTPTNANAPGTSPESRPSKLPVNVANPSASDLPVVKESVASNITLALGLVERGANIARHVPWIAPVFSLLSEIVKIYKEVKDTDEKRDQLLCRVTDITNDLCATILRMEETNHDDLIGRLKPDAEKYTALIAKINDAIRAYDRQKYAVRVWAHIELGSELDAFNHELDWFAARFTNNRLVDLVFKQDKNTETLKIIDERGREEKLEKWLQFPPQMMEKQNDMENLHQKGTGGWLFEDDKFTAWQDHAGFLWIQGQSGAGKSVLCSTVIRKLLDDQQLFTDKTASPKIGYFYFDFRDEKKQSVEIALRRILLQLSARSTHSYQTLDEEYMKSSGQNLPNYGQLLQILKELLGKLGRTYIVLDALDECKEADYQRLVELISKLQRFIEGASHLLQHGASIQEQSGKYGNVLQAAAYQGNTEMVHFLLEKGADINAQGGEYGNALQAAAYLGNTETVHLLLEKGADINAQGGEYDNALQAAACKGETEIVHLLLEKGANINAQSGEYGNALQAAARDGETEIVHLLLEKGANINAQSGEYGNALQAAAYGGNTETVHLLLEKGADINAQGGEYGNALQAAAREGETEIVHLLLEKGADINAQGGEYGNALQAAAYGGNIETVHLLLEKGADITAQGGKYGNALQAAAHGGNAVHGGKNHIVHLLLEKGANIHAQGGHWDSALQAAAYWGNTEIVHVLLEKGADINARGGKYGNALQAAACWGNTETVHLLLEQGADINAQGGEYGNALQAAACWGNTETVHLLLEQGADINAQGGEYGNALQAAAYEGKTEIVHLLLEKGADINAQGGEYGNALQAAAHNGWTEIVHLLLEKGLMGSSY